MTGAPTQDPAGTGAATPSGVGAYLRVDVPLLAPRRSGWHTRTLIGTSAAAFFAGALFWHLVGFWSFLSGIVFNPQDGETFAIVRPPTSGDGGRASKAADHLPASGPSEARADQQSPAALVSPQIEATRPAPAPTELLAELLQCSEAIKSTRAHEPALVHACPPLRRRLPVADTSQRANRQLDAHEAAHRLAKGWQTGVSPIETGSLPHPR